VETTVTDLPSSGHIEVMATSAEVILLPRPAATPPAPVSSASAIGSSGIASGISSGSESGVTLDAGSEGSDLEPGDESIDLELDLGEHISIPPPLPARALSRASQAPQASQAGARTTSPSGAPGAAIDRRAAFRTMYEQHVDFVWRNLRRLGVSEAEVDDKAQEVFVIAHRRFDDFEERGHGPRAWLFQIVLRVASDARRHRRRHPVDPDGGAAQDRESVEPEQIAAFDRREALGRLDRALRTIEVGRRAVLVLHEIEEMTAPEISETLGVPLNTVYSRLRVARAELEAALAKEERFGMGDAR
jgi:RNA polymerase sigma-70 factor (ECF subfamily)